MSTNDAVYQDFLAQKRIAVAGVSRQKEQTANLIYRKLKSAGYTVYPINPNAETVEGDRCYPNLKSIPETIDGVVIVTKPAQAEQIVHECAEVGVRRVWMHRSIVPAGSSVSEEAVKFCREHNITAIAVGCPMMFCEPVDFGHKCMRWFLRVSGKLATG